MKKVENGNERIVNGVRHSVCEKDRRGHGQSAWQHHSQRIGKGLSRYIQDNTYGQKTTGQQKSEPDSKSKPRTVQSKVQKDTFKLKH